MPMPAKSTTKEENQGFQPDLQQNRIVCPVGKSTTHFAHRSGGKVYGSFSKTDCQPCARRIVCSPAPRGKIILMHVKRDTLDKRRAEMKTTRFKQEMHQRNGIEGTLSGLVRGHRLRNARYRGKQKLRCQIKFTAATANIKRLHRFYAIQRQE